MSIATQIERLQGVRDQIRTKMVSLGLSESTDLLQNLADDLDGIAAATANDVSGFVSGNDPRKITLTAAKTLGSSSTTATASATVTKGLYTGSSDIKVDLAPKTITATAEATLAGINGAIELTAETSAFTKTSTADYSNGFITSVKVNPTPSQSKVVTPTMTEQTVSPDTGKLLSMPSLPLISIQAE